MGGLKGGTLQSIDNPHLLVPSPGHQPSLLRRSGLASLVPAKGCRAEVLARVEWSAFSVLDIRKPIARSKSHHARSDRIQYKRDASKAVHLRSTREFIRKKCSWTA